MMTGMNKAFYSFSGGNLWKHNVATEDHNNFYGSQSYSELTSVFNDSVLSNKLFKNIYLKSTDEWRVDLVTDQQTGYIESSWFEKKEGAWYSFVRNVDEADFSLRSVNGLGTVTTVDATTATAVTLTFPSTFQFGSIISIGDIIYYGTGTPVKGGQITAINNTTKVITIDTTISGGSAPSNGDFLCYVKNGIAESHGVLGQYCKFTIKNELTDQTDLFVVQADIMSSYPTN